MNAVNKGNLFRIQHPYLDPWSTRQTIPEHCFGKITVIKYEVINKQRLCSLKVSLLDRNYCIIVLM